MKPLAIAVIGTGIILGGITLTKESTIKYVQSEPEIVEKQIEIETLQKRIDDAITASSTDIELKAKESYEETKVQMYKEIELEVTRTYREEIEVREAELEEQVSL